MPNTRAPNSCDMDSPDDLSYPIVSHLEYQITRDGRRIAAGTGRTVTMSAHTVCFESENGLPLGELIELAVVWPARLDNRIPLKLRIVGRTVRVSGLLTTIKILKYEFRTMGARSSLGRAESGGLSRTESAGVLV